MTVIYVSFADASDAEKAAGALLDHGVDEEDLSFVRADIDEEQWQSYEEGQDLEDAAEKGYSTTTAADAGLGAGKGAAAGLVAGALAGLAMLWVPPLGLALGSGALATALGATAAAGAAGAVAGAVTGYLKDQGVALQDLEQVEDHLEQGGAVIEVDLPSGGVDLTATQEILTKYDAHEIVVK
jgi:hypothetical protein